MKFIRKRISKINEAFFDDDVELTPEEIIKKEQEPIFIKSVKEYVSDFILSDIIDEDILNYDPKTGQGAKYRQRPSIADGGSIIEVSASNVCFLAEKIIETNNQSKLDNWNKDQFPTAYNSNSHRAEILPVKDMIEHTVNVEFNGGKIVIHIWLTHRFYNADEITIRGTKDALKYIADWEKNISNHFGIPVEIRFMLYGGNAYIAKYNNDITENSVDDYNDKMWRRNLKIKLDDASNTIGKYYVDEVFDFLEKFDNLPSKLNTLIVSYTYSKYLGVKSPRKYKFKKILVPAPYTDTLYTKLNLDGAETILTNDGYVELEYGKYLNKNYIHTYLSNGQVQESDIIWLNRHKYDLIYFPQESKDVHWIAAKHKDYNPKGSTTFELPSTLNQ